MTTAARTFASRYGATVSWFPGHMAAATRQLADLVLQADVVIEVRDARVPFSSANPLLDNIASFGIGQQKPRVIVFNKADLANDQLQTRISAVEKARGFECVFTSADKGTNIGRILKHVDAVQTKASQFKAAGAVMIIAGIPNVGKSTLINAIRGVSNYRESKGAATAPTPGFTRQVTTMRVRKSPPLFLCDSPGIMMPRVNDIETGLKLAVTTAVREASVPWLVQAEYLLYYFATIGNDRFSTTLGLSKAYDETEVEAGMAEYAMKIGARKPGGAPDLETASRHFVRLFQDGKLGRYTLDYVPGVG